MEFKNNGKSVKVRFGDRNVATWKTVKTGQIVDLPLKVGNRYNFQAVKIQEAEVKAEVKVQAKPKEQKAKK